MTDKKEPQGPEKRRYIRVNGNFPIDFTMVRLQDDLLDLPWSKGHTSNISKGGICLETDVLSEPVIKYLSNKNLYLDLRIHLPSMKGPIKAVAEVVWYRPIPESPNCYIIGLDFRSIIDEDLKTLISQAWCIRAVTKVLSVIAIVGFVGALGNAYLDQSNKIQEGPKVSTTIQAPNTPIIP